MAATYLTSGHAARRLGISRRTLARAVQRGEILPALRSPGGWLRFAAADVDAYAQRLSVPQALDPSPAGVDPSEAQCDACEEPLHAEGRYRLIAELAADYAYSFAVLPDGTRVLEWIGDAFERVTGYSCADMHTEPVQAALIHPGDLSTVVRRTQTLLSGQAAACEYRIVTKGGEVRWLRDEARPLWDDAQGRVVRIVGAAQDITERKQAEQEAERARAAAEELARLHAVHAREAEALSEVSAALAHELDPDKLYGIILEQTARIIPCDYVHIGLYQDGWLVVAAAWGQPPVPVGTRLFPLTVDARWMPRARDTMVSIPDTTALPGWTDVPPHIGAYRVGSMLLVPLVVDGQAVGSFAICSRRPHSYADRHVSLATTLGARVTIALRNARLYAAEQAARAQAEQAEANLRAIIAASPLPMVTFDLEGVVRSWNAAAERVFGWHAEEVVGRPAPMVLEDVQLREQIPVAAGMPDREVGAQTKDGSRIDLFVSAAPLRDAAGDLVGTMGVYMDITERKRADVALRHQASHDSLTGLPNRALLHERLDGILGLARRTGQLVSLLLLDLDRFKEVNDALGHHIGDLLLRQIASRLQRALGATETLARLGGDEFAVVLPAADTAAAAAVARLVLSTLEPPFQVEQHLLDLGGSIGIAAYPDHGADALTLLRHADVAMYVAKRAHSGVALYDPSHDRHTVRRLGLNHDLRRAIQDGGLCLHYQPKVALTTGQVCGVEALLRWQHPAHGFIPPAEFIPLAEQSGVIIPLTDWVLATALGQARAWQGAGRARSIAVNLSARSLQDHRFPEIVARLLERQGVAPPDLTLEITESTLMADPVRAREVLTRLHALGVRVAIDDFGTGYSSLGYLKELPVDEVKVDKSFVLGMGAGDEKDAAIVRSIVAMAHALGLAVVAEGVEDAAAYALLGRLGCDVAQGYYLSRPLPAEALDRWLLDEQFGREDECVRTAPLPEGYVPLG